MNIRKRIYYIILGSYSNPYTIIWLGKLRINNMRNKVEKLLDKYNHTMEFIRTLLAIIMIGLQLYIITYLLK